MIVNISKLKRSPLIRQGLVALLFIISCAAGTTFGQANDSRNRNNPYSPSPSPKAGDTGTVKTPTVKPLPSDVAFVMQKSSRTATEGSSSESENRPTLAKAIPVAAKTTTLISAAPSEIYKIGIGDVLLINLKNSAQGSGYYTVMNDGTIDYPLAGENVVVADKSVVIIEETLRNRIKLFAEPRVEIKIREYGSHKITVSGLADNKGQKSLQREAIPLFAIRAEAGVSPKATKVRITRSPQLPVETYILRDAGTDDVLIFPGNALDFIGETGTAPPTGVYFISGEIVSAGQKDLTYGLTLYQAVAAAGGTKGDPKLAIVRRKNEKGFLGSTDYNLRLIKEGKSLNPILLAGDVIEIGN